MRRWLVFLIATMAAFGGVLAPPAAAANIPIGRLGEPLRVQFEGLVADGAEGIILGCTEIELLVTGEDCPVPVFPTARLHIEAAVEAAFG